MKRILFLSIAIAAFLWASAYAAEPPTKPTQTGTTPIQRQPEGAPLAFPEQMISGTVTDAGGRVLGGVVIKLFASGTLVEVAHTTAAGAYEMPLPLTVDRDETVVLWFMSTTESVLPQSVILKQSSRARSYRLFSACTPEVKMRPQMRVDVKLLSENETLAALKGKGCL